MTPIQCTGKDGIVRTFWYVREQDPLDPVETWHFEVHRQNPSHRDVDDVFLMTFRKLNSASFYVLTATNNGHLWYRAKGISDALIPEVARLFGKAILSSSNVQAEKRHHAESRNVAGAEVWERFVALSAAYKCEQVDRFVFVGFLPPPQVDE